MDPLVMRVDESLEVVVHSGYPFRAADGNVTTCAVESRGLAAFGHPECVVFVESSHYSEVVPTELGQLFAAIRQQALAGRIARAGQWTALGRPLATMPWASGFAWVAAPPAFPGKLAGVPIVEDELSVLVRRGSTRILSRLGSKARYFPTAYWAHRRNSAARGADGDGPLKGIPAGHGAGAWVYSCKDGLEVYPGADLPALTAQLPDDAAFIVPCGYGDADSMLTWEPGADDPAAIQRGTEPPERIGGAYFVLANSPYPGLQFVEDGYAVLLDNEAYATAYKALRTGTACEVMAGRVKIRIHAP